MPESPMARIHPSTPLHNPLTAGDYRERDILAWEDAVNRKVLELAGLEI